MISLLPPLQSVSKSVSILFCLGCLLMMAGQASAYEKVYYTQEQALAQCFPSARSIETIDISIDNALKQTIEQRLGFSFDKNTVQIFKGYSTDGYLGSALILHEKGKYEPITFMVHISPEKRVSNVILMIYREKVGAEVRKKRFLRQFFGKHASSSIVVDQDIDGISGATISSWALAAGVKKALILSDEI
ncbi:MAG: FMN-binding protein [bacterium]